jgi:hypothetical protein
MTKLESESLDTLQIVRDLLVHGPVVRKESYVDVLGRVTRVLALFENMRMGCPTGKHSSYCSCRPAVEGKAIPGLH